MSIDNNITFLENVKQGFTRTISWSKYRSEITTYPKKIDLNSLIDPTYRNTFDQHYMPLIEIKDFNALFDYKWFFDQPVKQKQEATGKLLEMSRNDNNNRKPIRLFVSSKIL